jgi:hypothetical protein
VTFDGIKMRRAPHLGYRRARDGEEDADGNKLDDSYLVIVSKADCPTVRGQDGREFYDPEGVEPHVPQKPEAGSSMVYAAEWNKSGDRWTLPVYRVHDGLVYQGRLISEEKPDN